MPNEKEQGHEAEAPTKGKECETVPFCGTCKREKCVLDCTNIPGKKLHSLEYCHGACQPPEPQAREEWEEELKAFGQGVEIGGDHSIWDFPHDPSRLYLDSWLFNFIRQLLSRSHAQGYEEGVRASLEALPEKDESDGWEEFFDRKNVGVCCPGDDLANGWNAARAAISDLLTQGKE